MNATFYPVGVYTPLPERLTLKLRSFASLKLGWDYGAGEPISDNAIAAAFSWCDFLHSLALFDVDAFPGGSGEILLGIKHGDYYIEVIIEKDGTVSIACDLRGDQSVYQPRLQPEDARKALIELAGKICTSSAYFIPADLILESIGSQVWLSGIHPETAVYQSSTRYAYNQPGQSYAITLGNTTQTLPLNRQYFGNSMSTSFPRAIA